MFGVIGVNVMVNVIYDDVSIGNFVVIVFGVMFCVGCMYLLISVVVGCFICGVNLVMFLVMIGMVGNFGVIVMC